MQFPSLQRFILSLWIATFLAFPTQAIAETLAEAINAANESKAFNRDQHSALITLIKKQRLGSVTIADSAVSSGVLTGAVTTLGQTWHLTAVAVDRRTAFISLRPHEKVSFSDLLGDGNLGAAIDESLPLEQPILVITNSKDAVALKDLPKSVSTILSGSLPDGEKSKLALSRGYTLYGLLDTDNSTLLTEAMEFLGGKTSKTFLSASIQGISLDGKNKNPSLAVNAQLPKFTPTLGGVIKLPGEVQFGLGGKFDKLNHKFTLAGVGKLDIGGSKLPTEFTLNIQKDKKKKTVVKTLSAKAASKAPWESALGLDWLTISNYKLKLTKSTTAMNLSFSGKTTLGQKTFNVAGSAVASPKTGGAIKPETAHLSLAEKSNEPAELSIDDLVSIYAHMLKTSGLSVKMPSAVPDVALGGTAPGKGPTMTLVLQKTKQGDGPGINMAGVLRLFGSDLVTVDRAFIDAKNGIDIAAKAAVVVGPLKLNNSDIRMNIKMPARGQFQPPKLYIQSGNTQTLLGVKVQLEAVLEGTTMTVRTDQTFGKHFEFDFAAVNRAEIASLEHLAQSELLLQSSLRADPVQWIRDNGKKAVEKAFGGVNKEVDKAVKKIETAQKDLDAVTKSLNAMKAKVTKERGTVTEQMAKAESEVKKFQDKIKDLDSKIASAKKDIKKCDQTKKQCVWGKVEKVGCKEEAKVFGKTKCIIPKLEWRCQKEKTFADIPARTRCEAKKVAAISTVAGLEVTRGTLVPSLEIAQKSLQMLQDGVENIPLEFDPRVAALVAAEATAQTALKVAKGAVKSFGKFDDLLAKGLDVFGNAKVFALEKSTIRGDLSRAKAGKPVVIDLHFTSFNKSYHQAMAFSLTDMEFNAKQFKVIPLGIASRRVIELAKKSKVVPENLMDKITDIYGDKLDAVEKALRKALRANDVDEPERKTQSLADFIEQDQRQRNVIFKGVIGRPKGFLK